MLVSTLFPLLTILSSAMASQFPIPPLPQTPDADMPGTYHPEVVDMPSIADVLNSQSRSTIFYDYLREIDSISKMVSTNHGNELTLLVPTNKAVIALPRKPNQGTSDTGITEEEFDSASHANVLRWVTAHIVASPVFVASGESYPTMLKGTSVHFEKAKGASHEDPDWKRFTLAPQIQILNKFQASNGVVYIIDGTVLA